MANIFPALVMAHPSHVMPGLVMRYQQRSGAFALLGGRKPTVQLGEGDQYVYGMALDLRTKVAVGQMAYNQLPSCTLVASQFSTPTYLIRTRAEYDHHDTAEASRWNVSLTQAQRLAMRQAIFQQQRNMLLYGINPANGEGLLNTPGATTVNLPADVNGNTTFGTYDNGQLAFFLLGQIQKALSRMYQFGNPLRICITGPQEVLSPMEMQDIVQVTQFQRVGAGTQTTKGVIQSILGENGCTLEWTYDDTLIGKGAGGTDAVVISIAEIDDPSGSAIGGVDTNEFGEVSPSLKNTSVMLTDMAAPREIPTPIAGGAIDVLAEMRSTCGWGIRGEAVTIISGAP